MWLSSSSYSLSIARDTAFVQSHSIVHSQRHSLCLNPQQCPQPETQPLSKATALSTASQRQDAFVQPVHLACVAATLISCMTTAQIAGTKAETAIEVSVTVRSERCRGNIIIVIIFQTRRRTSHAGKTT